MIKPDGLWNFFKSGPDVETIGRVCMALAGREGEIGEPLNKYELGYLREIVNSDEWHEDASQRITDRKRRDYLQKKQGLSDNEKGELEILTSRLSIRPSLAKKAKMTKVEKTENAEIRMYPSVHPSIRPSVQENKKEEECVSLTRTREEPSLEMVLRVCRNAAVTNKVPEDFAMDWYETQVLAGWKDTNNVDIRNKWRQKLAWAWKDACEKARKAKAETDEAAALKKADAEAFEKWNDRKLRDEFDD